MTTQQRSTLQALHNQAVTKARLWQATQRIDNAKAKAEADYRQAEANFSDYLISLSEAR